MGQLHPFRVNHDEFNLVGRSPEKDRGNKRVDTDRFSGAGRAGDQNVGHFADIGDNSLAGNIQPQRNGKFGLVSTHFRRGKHPAQGDKLRYPVRNFHTNQRAAGNGGFNSNLASRGSQSKSEVIAQSRNFGEFSPQGNFQSVLGHRRTGVDLHDLGRNAKRLKGFFNRVGVVIDIAPVSFTADFFRKQGKRRKAPNLAFCRQRGNHARHQNFFFFFDKRLLFFFRNGLVNFQMAGGEFFVGIGNFKTGLGGFG